MESPYFIQWQEWEKQVQQWLNQPDDELDISNTFPSDRRMLGTLAVKYQVWYRRLDTEKDSTSAEKGEDEKKATIKLSKIPDPDLQKAKERHRDKEKLFATFTGRLLTPEQVVVENSIEWQDFNQLYDKYGCEFLRACVKRLHGLIQDLISHTPQYEELIARPRESPLIAEKDSMVYQKNNDREIFLSVDIKSANFALLQHIHAIDPQTFPTWSEFLSFFIGPRPVFLQSKILRQHSLGKLPQYHKLQALWTNYTANIYKNTILNCVNDKNIDAICESFNGDEVVFHLIAPIEEEKVIDLVAHVQKCIIRHSPIVKFNVQAYRLKYFHWNKKHGCFARMFIGQGEGQFDLKCVPYKDRNYQQAYDDFRLAFNI